MLPLFEKRERGGGPRLKEMVGTGRFELPTPRTPSECSTRLSHVPTRKELKAPTWRAELGLTFQFYTTASPPPSPNYASIPSLMRPSGLMRVGSPGGSHTTFSFTVFTPGMLRIVVFTSRPISTCDGQPWAVRELVVSHHGCGPECQCPRLQAPHPLRAHCRAAGADARSQHSGGNRENALPSRVHE